MDVQPGMQKRKKKLPKKEECILSFFCEEEICG